MTVLNFKYDRANNFANVKVDVTPFGVAYNNRIIRSMSIDEDCNLTISMNGKASMSIDEFRTLCSEIERVWEENTCTS